MLKNSNSSSFESELMEIELETYQNPPPLPPKNNKNQCINEQNPKYIQNYNPENKNINVNMIQNHNLNQNMGQNVNQTTTQTVIQNLPNYSNQNMNQVTYQNSLKQYYSNSINILNKNDQVLLQNMNIKYDSNNYSLAALMLTIGILFCNPIILTVSYCLIPKNTSERQKRLMLWTKIMMIIFWVFYVLDLLIVILCSIILV